MKKSHMCRKMTWILNSKKLKETSQPQYQHIFCPQHQTKWILTFGKDDSPLTVITTMEAVKYPQLIRAKPHDVLNSKHLSWRRENEAATLACDAFPWQKTSTDCERHGKSVRSTAAERRSPVALPHPASSPVRQLSSPSHGVFLFLFLTSSVPEPEPHWLSEWRCGTDLHRHQSHSHVLLPFLRASPSPLPPSSSPSHVKFSPSRPRTRARLPFSPAAAWGGKTTAGALTGARALQPTAREACNLFTVMYAAQPREQRRIQLRCSSLSLSLSHILGLGIN